MNQIPPCLAAEVFDLPLVVSPHVGIARLGEAHGVVAHVLGRKRLIASATHLVELERLKAAGPLYALPRTAYTEALRAAGILQALGNDETGRIRAAYRRASRLARKALRPIGLVAAPEVGEAAEAGYFRLSCALAVAFLEEGDVLATHPCMPPTHLDAGLWEVALRFAVGRVATGEERHVAAFLQRRGLLWRSSEDEERACLAAFGLTADDLPELHLTDRAGDAFRQIHRPYTTALVDRAAAHKRVVLIGPCMAQQFAECLEHHGYTRGWAIEAVGLREPDASLTGLAPELIVMNAAQFVPYVVQFASRGQWDACDRLISRVVEAIEERLDAIRIHSTAPIAIAAAHPPALGVFPAGSHDGFRLRWLFAEINLAVARLADGRDSVRMLDEADARERLGLGTYWDDIINASAHRAPLSSWNWVLLKPGRSDGAADPALAPAPDPGGADPALAMAQAVLDHMARLTCRPIRTVIFEPRGLLWPAAPTARDLDQAAQRGFLVDVEDYWYAGNAEALAALSARGVRLIGVSDMPPDALDRGFGQASTTDILLGRAEIEDLVSTDDKAAVVGALAGSGEDPTSVILVIDLVTPPVGIPGVIALGPERRWDLREILLRSPELEDWRRLPSGERPASNSVAVRIHSAGSHHAQQVVEALWRALEKETGLGIDAIADTEHLADLGLDSLSFRRLLTDLEARLDVTLESWERGNADLLDVALLRQTLEAALRRRDAGTHAIADGVG